MPKKSSNGDPDERIRFISRYVKNAWKENKGLPPQFTMHDASHSEAVVKAVHGLIPKNKEKALSATEWFYLESAAWLHDIGMIPSQEELARGGPVYATVRKGHHVRSAEYIKKHRQELGLGETECSAITEIVQYHRKSMDIQECQEKFGAERLRLLAAYLRLADAIHIDKTRVEESLFKVFVSAGMDWRSRIHWLKSFLVNTVSPNHENLSIEVSLLASKKDADDIDVVATLIENEIRSELHTVKEVLIRGGVTYFLDVNTTYGPGIQDDLRRTDVRQMVGNLLLENKASASDLADTIADTVLPILGIEDKRQAYATIRTYEREVVQDLVAKRPCHLLAQKVGAIVSEETTTVESELTDDEVSTKLENLEKRIQRFRDVRNDYLTELFQHTRGIVSDYGSILLFGCSRLVVKALEGAPDEAKKRTEVYIAECKSKNQYSDLNELVHCDGLDYASCVKEAGFRNVKLVPDILVGNLLSRGLVQKVVFGANGVDLETGKFGHTAGHLTIADLAQVHGVPVYVVVDSAKFGKISERPGLQRDIPWVTGDPKALAQLEGVELLNPREDIVPAAKVFALVTDCGVFPPTEIPERVRERVDALLAPSS